MDFATKEVPFEGRKVFAPISPYPYQPCQPHAKELRFVRILPADGGNDMIECELFHKSIDNVENFVALSYQWGDPSCCKIITLNGYQVPVTTNLLEALQHLRKAKLLVLWIDALCINQEDDGEKDSHLKLMKDVYHGAKTVCAYIGQASDGSKRVMELLRMIDSNPDSDRAEGIPNELQILSLEAELKAFFSRPYWHRAWVIQEIALSSRLIVHCGDLSVQWTALESLLLQLRRLQQFKSMDDTVEYLRGMRLKQLRNEHIGLLELLYETRFAEATDPRDKLYALLGLCFDGTKYVSEAHYKWDGPRICLNTTRTVIAKRRSLDIIFAKTGPMANGLPSWCPDYLNCPSDEIWRKVAAYITGHNIRSRMGQTSARWTATNNDIAAGHDLSSASDRFLTVRGFSLGVIDSIGCAFPEDVGKSPRTAFTASVENKIKGADKKLFGSLTEVLNLYARPMLASASASEASPAQKPSSDIGSGIGAAKLYYYLYDFDRFYKSMNHQKYQAEFERIQKWRSLNKDFMIQGKTFRKRAHDWPAIKAAGRLTDMYSIPWKQMSDPTTSSILNNAPHMGPLGPLITGGVAVHTIGKVWKMPSDLEDALLSLSDIIGEGLRLVTTDSGYIGWVHPAAELGDHVYLVQACSMPAILRPSQSEGTGTDGNVEETNGGPIDRAFSVVGHAMINGAMDGKLWSSLTRSKTMETLRLE